MSDLSDNSHQQGASIGQQQQDEQSYGQSNQNNQFIDHDVPAQQNENFFQINGMYFCGDCNNMIEPYSTKGELLEFRCKKCADPILINFKARENSDCMMYSKALQEGSRKTIADSNFIFDQSMPRMLIDCPECGHPEAIYMITPGEGQRKIVVTLICLSGVQFDLIQCGYHWELDEESEIFKDSVKLVGTQNNIEQQD